MSRLRKMIAFSTALFLLTLTTAAQTLFTYGNMPVSKQEFLKAYNKNNTEKDPTEKSYRDYLDLYIRFKLKVQAAMDAHLDTLASQKNELETFRNQIADNYMKDDASVDELVDQAFTRAQKDLRLAHIFVAVRSNAPESEVQKARQKIEKAYAQLKKGLSFGKVAVEYSEDPSVKDNKGEIGYVTVFSLPYDIENVAYATPPGKYSKPFRSKSGFHILKVLDERKALGKVQVAQILLAFPPGATDAQKEDIRRRADSLYAAIKAGSNFKKLAEDFSNDNLTYRLGGEMPAFGVGRYEPAFESAAFALKKDGDLSRPFLTSYGYHILERLKRMPVATSKKDQAAWSALKQEVVQSDRMEVAQKMFLKKIGQLTGAKKYAVNQTHLRVCTDSVLNHLRCPRFADLDSNTALFSFADKTIRVRDWIDYLISIRNAPNLRGNSTNAELFDQYFDNTARQYYRDHLETYNKDFAYQMKEFREGNLLFEVMQRKVWDKASSDSTGLENYYETHKSKYWWQPSANAIIFTCSNEIVAEEGKKKLEDDIHNWRTVVENSNGMIQADSGRFELSQIPVIERTRFANGLFTAPVKNQADNSVTFCYIITMHPNREQRGFNDARGFVINDYQTYLEDEWIAQLKKKYPVRVDEAVFKSLYDLSAHH